MSVFTLDGARLRRFSYAAITGLAATTIAVAPASALPGCDGVAADAADFEEELQCASDATDGPQTITLTASFEVPAYAENLYDGSQQLTIEGADGVEITGPRTGTDADSPFAGTFLTVISPEFDGVLGVPSLEEPVPAEGDSSGATVTLRNLTIKRFRAAGAVAHFSVAELAVIDTRFQNNSIEDAGGFLPLSGAITAGGPVSISGSTFVNNTGFFGGAVGNYPVFFTIMGEGPEDSEPSFEDLPSITVTDSVMRRNSAQIGGGLVALGPLDVSGSRFVGNAASAGGAVAAVGTTTTIADSRFVDNVAGGDGDFEGGDGGAIAFSGDTTITGATLTGNQADGFGGAIAPIEGPAEAAADLTVTDTVLAENTAGDEGAAIAPADFGTPGTLTLDGVTVRHHESSDDVSVIAWEGDVDVASSVLRANVMEEGTLLTVEGSLAIDGSTVRNNEAENSIVIVEAGDGDAVSVTNSTFVGNDLAAGEAATVLAFGAEGTTAAVEHSTFWNNRNTEGGPAALAILSDGAVSLNANVFASRRSDSECYFEADVTTAANFDADGTCTAGWSGDGDQGDGLDPMLEPLADNGGMTPTALPAEGSPLIDAVPADATTVAYDQRGVVRPQGAAKDIGAVEVAVEIVDPETPEAGAIEFQVSTPGGTITGTASPAVAVTDIAWVNVADLPTPPAGAALPFGAATFAVEVPEAGDAVTITLTAPRPFTSAFKVSDAGWEEIAGATFSADRMTVTYTLTDGGALDEDGTANGVIVDPVALAIEATFTG